MSIETVNPEHRNRPVRGLLALALVVPVVLSFGAPASAEPSGAPSSAPSSTSLAPSPDPSMDDGQASEPSVEHMRQSIEYLRSKYGVSEAEAVRRLRLQARAVELADKARERLGEEVLDVWLDQDGGGVLTFLTSQPDAARSALGADIDSGEIRVIQSKHTAAELAAAEAAVRSVVGDQRDVMVGVDRREERVVVHYSGTDTSRGELVRDRVGLADTGSVDVAVDTSGPPKDPGQQRACYILACDPPMRGGVRLHIKRDDGSFGSCTSGFNIRGSNGWVYMLTAGHCVTGQPGRQMAYHNGLPVAWEKSTTNDAIPSSPPDLDYSRNDYPRWDWAMLPYQTTGAEWGGYWIEDRDQHNIVNADCVSPSNQPCGSYTTLISGMYTWFQIQTGWVVCATGTGTSVIYPATNTGYSPGSRCGVIQDKNMYTYTLSLAPEGRGLKVDICSRPGDSGGPLYSQVDNMAYGILSGGPTRSGSCDMGHPDEYSVYSPLSEILSDASYTTGITMSLITTASG